MPGLSLIDVGCGRAAAQFSPIEIVVSPNSGDAHTRYAARIARTDLFLDESFAALDASLRRSVRTMSGVMPAPINAPDIVSSGWLGQALRGFRCWIDASGQQVRFDDGMGFSVSRDGARIDAFELPDNEELRAELLLGPALLLAFAARGIFGLHASAVLGSAGAVLLLGPSGSGKSTLARHAISEGGLRLTDDVTPVVSAASGVRVLPRFPQLKLTPALIVDDLEVPLTALIWVELAEGALGIEKMEQQAMTRCLLRDTVAARMFAPEILSRHLDFCAALTLSIPGWRLSVPSVASEQRRDVVASAYQLLRMYGLP